MHMKWFAVLSLCLLSQNAVVANAAPKPTSDARIFSIFDQFNSFDIQAAKLALDSGNSKDVLAVGKMIVTDHVSIQKESRQLVTRLGIEFTPSRNKEFELDLKELGRYSGAKFDRKYIQRELAFSQEFVRTLKEELIPAAQNPGLKKYLAGVLPQFEAHLAHINHVAISLGLQEGQPHEAHHHH